MNQDEMRAEVAKGLKTFKVFQAFHELLEQSTALNADLSDKRKKIEKEKLELETISKHKLELVSEIEKLNKSAKEILSDADKKAKEVKSKAQSKADEMISNVEQAIDKMYKDTADAKKELASVLKLLSEKRLEFDNLVSDIEKTKNELRKIL